MKILLIDNYDSFTFNLYHYLSSLKTKTEVVRNDKINSKEILKKKFDRIIISPGPGNPNQAGNCISIALIFGAPETVPAGKPAKRDLNFENLLLYSPITFDTMCIT